MADLEDLTARMRECSEARDWGRSHDLRSLTLALVGEVDEVAELVQRLPSERTLRTMHRRRPPDEPLTDGKSVCRPTAARAEPGPAEHNAACPWLNSV